MNIWKPIVLVLALALGSCTSFERGIAGAGLAIQQDEAFSELVLADVVEAKKLANQANDLLALKCWDYVEAFVVANAPSPESPMGKVIGVLSTYQQARNVRRIVIEVKISDEFRIACGPMLTDSMGALGRLGIRIVPVL